MVAAARAEREAALAAEQRPEEGNALLATDGLEEGPLPLKSVAEGPSSPAPGALRTVGSVGATLLCAGFVLVLLGVVLCGSPPFPSAPTKVASLTPSRGTFFDLQDLPQVMPLAPSWYPDNLKGVVWLDMHGAYGFSDVPPPMPADLAVSFGDVAFNTLNLDTHIQYVSTSGPGWVWANTEKTYGSSRRNKWYLFFWNADYTEARLWWGQHVDGRNWFGLGPTTENLKRLTLQYWLVRQTPPAGACPPAANATKEERSLCATWLRRTCVFWCIGSSLGYNLPLHYYVFEVVDRHGRKVEPYFSEMVRFAEVLADPHPASAKELGFDAPKGLNLSSRSVAWHGTY